MAGPSTIVKSGRWGVTLTVYDYGDAHSLAIPHNDDFTWEYGETEDVDIMEGGEYVTTLKGVRVPVSGQFSLNFRADTNAAAAAFLDVVFYRSYVRSNWTPTNQINAAAYDTYGQKAMWTLKHSVPEPAPGAGSTHVTTIAYCTFKASSQSGDKITETINYRGWTFTQS